MRAHYSKTHPLKIGLLAAISFYPIGALRALPNIGETQAFSVAEASRVPGAILKSGKYSISTLNYLSDRSILQVKDPSGHAVATFIGIRRRLVPDGMGKGLTVWSHSPYPERVYRGWVAPQAKEFFEFAYPKGDAVAVAKSNREEVPAIDPESQGMVSGPGLSTDDMKVVNLWLLSTGAATAPDTGEGAIQASRFQPAGTLTAQAAPIAKRLPRTGSNVPLIGFAGLAALGAFSVLSLWGRRAG